MVPFGLTTYSGANRMDRRSSVEGPQPIRNARTDRRPPLIHVLERFDLGRHVDASFFKGGTYVLFRFNNAVERLDIEFLAERVGLCDSQPTFR